MTTATNNNLAQLALPTSMYFIVTPKDHMCSNNSTNPAEKCIWKKLVSKFCSKCELKSGTIVCGNESEVSEILNDGETFPSGTPCLVYQCLRPYIKEIDANELDLADCIKRTVAPISMKPLQMYVFICIK